MSDVIFVVTIQEKKKLRKKALRQLLMKKR